MRSNINQVQDIEVEYPDEGVGGSVSGRDYIGEDGVHDCESKVLSREITPSKTDELIEIKVMGVIEEQ
jgi:hypothetical protein